MSLGSRHAAVRRHSGHRGGIIAPHRALRTLDMRASRFSLTVLVSLSLTATWIALLNHVTRAWAAMLRFLLEFMSIDASVEMADRTLGGWTLTIPRLLMAPAELTDSVWWIGTLACVVALALSWLIPRRLLPLAYLLRLMVLVQASAQIFFHFSPREFPYDIAGYSEALLTTSAMIIGIIPTLYAFTFYPLDFSRAKKISITLLAMSHLTLFVPMQYLAHALALKAGSLLLMPLLFWSFGLTVDIFVIIALYGWAASWETLPYQHRSWWVPMRPLMPAVFVTLVVFVILGAAANAHGEDIEWDHELRVGGSYGKYDNDLGTLDSQHLRYRASRRLHDSIGLELGRAARFGDEGLGIGASYRRNVRSDTAWNLGGSTGSGDVIFPEWRVDAGLEHGLFAGDPLIVSLGYTHIQSKAENRSDGYQLGLRYYTPVSLIFTGFGRIDEGMPGNTTSRSAGFGLLYHRAGRYSLGAGVEFGDVSYVLVQGGNAFVDFNSRAYNAGGSWYGGDTWGLASQFRLADTDVYELWSAQLEFFRTW